MRKKLAVVLIALLAIAGAATVGQIRALHLAEYAERNNCTWTYYYDKPICK